MVSGVVRPCVTYPAQRVDGHMHCRISHPYMIPLGVGAPPRVRVTESEIIPEDSSSRFRQQVVCLCVYVGICYDMMLFVFVNKAREDYRVTPSDDR